MPLRRCLPLVLIVLLFALTSAPPAPTLAAVTISSFEAQGQVGQIVVMWTTANEVNNVGFHLWRDTSVNFLMPTHLNNGQLVPSQCIGCIVGTDYVYTDTNVTSGQPYYYQLESVDTDGHFEWFGPVSAHAIAPSSAPTRPPTHTPMPSPTPTPTDTPTPIATGTGGPSSTATATLSIPTPMPTSTPQPETPAASEPAATATATALVTPATPLPPSPTPTPPVEPERTPTSSVSTAVAPTAAQRPTATHSTTTLAAPSVAAPTATPKKSGASISTPTRPARLLSPAAETPQVELVRVLIGVGLTGLGAVLGLSVLGIVVYFLWRRPSRP